MPWRRHYLGVIALVLWLVAGSAAQSLPDVREPRALPVRRRVRHADPAGVSSWAVAERARLRAKYSLGDERDLLRRDGTPVNLTNYRHDGMWSLPIDVGTPPRPYEMIFDSGSADLWLTSAMYKPETSSSYRDLKMPYTAKYASGIVSGTKATETVRMGNFTSTTQGFALATNVSDGILTDGIAGIIGFGLSGLSSLKMPTFWASAELPKPIFSVFIEREIAGSDAPTPGGYLTLGGMNDTLYDGEISFVPVLNERFWSISMQGLHVVGQNVPMTAPQMAAIDTGTTLIGGPDDVVSALYAKINGSQQIPDSPGYYAYPCNADLKVTLAFGGKAYEITAVDFKVQVLDPAELGEQTDGGINAAEAKCLGAIFSLGPSSPSGVQWIIGDAFLKNVYTIFDASKPTRVGFAALPPRLNSGSNITDSTDMLIGGAARCRPTLAALLTATLCAVHALL